MGAEFQRMYPAVFKEDRLFSGKLKLERSAAVKPGHMAIRLLPIALKDPDFEQLRLEQQKIIRKVSEPTDWFSAMTVVRRQMVPCTSASIKEN